MVVHKPIPSPNAITAIAEEAGFVAADVLEGANSIVWDQAENKMHMHKAILESFISGGFFVKGD